MTTAIGIDIGGTFIDIVVVTDGRLQMVKVSSTPSSPSRGVLDALAAEIAGLRIDPEDVLRVVHGTTVATNALLEGTWAKAALITTAGFRDVLEIGRQNRPSLYDLFVQRPPEIIPRSLRFEVKERVDSRGVVLEPLDGGEIERLAAVIGEAEVEAIAVCFLFSYLHKEHEREARRLLMTRIPLPVVLSSDVLPEFREFERTSTTAICAVLRPIVGDYLTHLERGSAGLGLPDCWQIMQSSGSVTRADTAQEAPGRILLSGPAAGVEGARAIGELIHEPNLITMDMGGTSCDVALIEGGVAGRTTEGTVGGYPVALPMIGIHTIGAGGGSIAWIDEGGALRVGPQSAGAVPGPACYGRGGRLPTVTDAHAVLGHLLPDAALGGIACLNVESASTAVETVAATMGISVEQAALGILSVADSAMERAIRVISVEKGYDPRDFALLAFGGAGPLHAVSVARGLSIPRVIVPAAAGVLSAVGLLTADTGHDLSQGLVRPFDAAFLPDLQKALSDLVHRGRRLLIGEGCEERAVRYRASVDLRYVGQSHELNVPFPSEDHRRLDEGVIRVLRDRYDEMHRTRFGHASDDRPVEVVALRLQAAGPPTRLDLRTRVREERAPERQTTAWFDAQGPVTASVWDRGRVPPGFPVIGPAIFAGDDATLVVPRDVSGTCDEYGTIVLEMP